MLLFKLRQFRLLMTFCRDEENCEVVAGKRTPGSEAAACDATENKRKGYEDYSEIVC